MVRETIKLPKAWEALASSKRKALLQKAIDRAYKRLGLILTARMRRKIRGGVPPANRPMTVALKGSSKPLADSGRLFKSITWKVEGTGIEKSLRVGVIKTSDEGANVAKIVHNGATIVVTPKMAKLFSVISSATMGRPVSLYGRAEAMARRAKGPVYPMRVGTTITIPPRPFALMTLKDPKTPADVRRIFLEELSKGIEGAK